ncbi:MAG: oligopeptide transporter, OPT family [Pseudomonadota bacterium]
MSDQQIRKLPDNAFRPLQPGETYVPMVTDSETVKEVSWRTVIIGLLMTVIFSAAAGFIALKTGQGFETAIPIVIISVGLSTIFPRKSTVLENVNIMAIGATASGAIGGTIFTLPALWILGVEQYAKFFQIFLVALLGTWMGILLLIPFRRYFVTEMHGKLPFPEGTAIVRTLVAGEAGGAQAKTLAWWGVFGLIFDSILYIFRGWREVVTTSLVPILDPVTKNAKLVYNMMTSGAMVGLGVIIGVNYAGIILAGSILSWWIFVPLFPWIAEWIRGPLAANGFVVPAMDVLQGMDAGAIFRGFVRQIGIGGIFAAGLISIFKLRKVVYQALTTGMQGLFTSLRKKGAGSEPRRTDRDIDMGKVLLMFIGVAVLIFLYFRLGVLVDQPGATTLSLTSLLIVLVISFLFSAVSAWAIAMISITPISGMTATALIITGLVLVKMGLTGQPGMLAAILIGGVICTSLAMSGTMVTELKIAQWTGATPKKVQVWSLLGAILASVTTAYVIILLAQTHGYVASPAHPNPMPAPQANAMAAIVKGFFSAGGVPWILYGIGALIAIIVAVLKISPLAFALGIYLPLEINTSIFLGAFMAWLLKKRSKDEKEAYAREEKGQLIASGLIAGGGLAGIASAIVIIAVGEEKASSLLWSANEGATGNVLGLVLFVALLFGIYYASKRRKPA